MDYSELVKELRGVSRYTAGTVTDLCKEAADAIEELSRENESLAKSVNEASEILRKRWIPVTEQAPEKEDMVIFYYAWTGLSGTEHKEVNRMSDYISREVAIETVCYNCPEANICGGSCDDTDRLRSIPAADVREARRGHWVKARGSWCTPGGDPVWECSECGKGRHVYGIEHGTYGADVADGQWVSCPNCGCKMDGGRE